MTLNSSSSVNIRMPYGTIPKFNKSSSVNNSHKTLKRKPSLTSPPYPYYNTNTNSTSLFTFFNQLFQKTNTNDVVGFMPSSSNSLMTQTSTLDITISIPISKTNPIDCNYTGNNNNESDNTSLSTSNSSTSSEDSLDSLFDDISDEDLITSDDDDDDVQLNDTLSDLLCEHYVQSNCNNNLDIPLETFSMHESTSTTTCNNWLMNPSKLKENTKDWKLVTKKKQAEEVKITKEPVLLEKYYSRDIRSNADYLRMIVAEVNMMRAEKIVGPLKERRILPKRSDKFMYKSSPLRSIVVS